MPGDRTSRNKRKTSLQHTIPSKRNRNETFTYKVANFENDFIANIRRMYASEEFCDLTLVASDKFTEIKAHGIVILSTIPELKNHWNPGNERHLLELDLNPRVLRLLVDFCYNGEIKIDREDDLLLLYIFCGFYNIRALNPLFDEHSTYLNSIENLFLILNQSHYPDEAFIFREKCLKKIVRIIGYVSQMDLFPTLSAKALGEILRHEDLMIDPEDKVLEIFLKWYYKLPKFKLEHDSIDTVRNDPDVKYVLAGIRLPLVHPKYTFKFAEKIWSNHGAKHDLLFECYKWQTVKDGDADVRGEIENIRMKPRSFDEKCLITVGIHRLNGEICCELFFGKTWIPLPIVKTSNPFYYDCKLVLYNNGNDKSVMIIGGRVGNEYKKVQSLNLRTMAVESLKQMLAIRTKFAATNMEDRIYVAGGLTSGIPTKSVEEYDPITNEWKAFPSMNHERVGFTLIVFEDTLYALGGRNKERSINSVEYFDKTKNCWTLTTPMLESRMDFGAIAYNGSIYAIGGNAFRNKSLDYSELDTVERFDITTKRWTPVARLGQKRDGLTAVVYQNQLLAVGGFNEMADAQNIIEKYNENFDEWTEFPSLNASTGRILPIVVPNYFNSYAKF